MAVRNHQITERRTRRDVSFLVSDDPGYEEPLHQLGLFQAQGPKRERYVVMEHSFGSACSTRVIDILCNRQEAVQRAYSEAVRCAKNHSVAGTTYRDLTSFAKKPMKDRKTE
jgi:hypothetical protein